MSNVKFHQFDRYTGIKVGSKVKYCGVIYRVVRMYTQSGCTSMTLDLTHIQLDNNRPLSVPIGSVDLVLEEGRSTGRKISSLNS